LFWENEFVNQFRVLPEGRKEQYVKKFLKENYHKQTVFTSSIAAHNGPKDNLQA
jgi:hypothetical protein